MCNAEPEVPDSRGRLALAYFNLGEACRRSGRHAEAETCYGKALALYQPLREAAPNDPIYAIGQSYALTGTALLLRDSGKVNESLQWYDRAQASADLILKAEPRHTEARKASSHAHWGRARAYALLGRRAEAMQEFDRAEEMVPGRERHELHMTRAEAQARLGDHAAAVAAVKKLSPGPNDAVIEARIYSLASSAARRDDALPTPEKSRLAEEYARRAVERLEQAYQASKLANPGMLKELQTDHVFDSLRDRPEFQHILVELEKTGQTRPAIEK